MADQKPSNRERVREIVASIEQNIQDLFQSERYFDYLRTMSRFHSYSVNNTILIHMQRPHASMPAAGFNKWKQFGRHVKRGEKGLTIIAPTPLKKKIEEMRLDPDTKAPVLDRDGNIIMDEKTVEIPLFKPVKVFTADQTEGKPLPQPRHRPDRRCAAVRGVLWRPCGARLPYPSPLRPWPLIQTACVASPMKKTSVPAAMQGLGAF